jgi:hypothetical protein
LSCFCSSISVPYLSSAALNKNSSKAAGKHALGSNVSLGKDHYHKFGKCFACCWYTYCTYIIQADAQPPPENRCLPSMNAAHILCGTRIPHATPADNMHCTPQLQTIRITGSRAHVCLLAPPAS